MTQNYKRIARNTMFLYFRMIIIMAVSLYTTRIVLITLGVTDFGIYNVVASFVVMLAFLNSALTSATQRFITFELGKLGAQELQKVFSISMIIHIGLALVVFILAEIIGLWFLNNKLNIPVDRIEAAFWVFQFAVLSTMVNIIKVPYHAMVIAHEKMSFFAYMSILEALLRLAAVYLLVIIVFDKLVAYAAFTAFVVLMILGFYYFYNKKYYKAETTFSLTWDKPLAKEMLSFSGWSLFGSLAWMLMNHGINIMLNIFFGPAVNSARGISMQVNMAIGSLINSFRMAVDPQIVKMHSGENSEGMKHLSLLSARYTFYLALLLILPLYLEIETILNIWLVEVPEWTVEFCKLMLIFSLIQTFDMSFGTIFKALGNIKENQILGGVTYLLVLPMGYISYKFYDLEPTAILYIQIVAVIVVAFVVKVYLLNKLTDISFDEYWHDFLLPVLKVMSIVMVLSDIIVLTVMNPFVIIILSIIGVLLSIYYFDMSKSMRNKILIYITNYVGK
ncbi:oligosaccharide flippase family protein [Sulfurospirillum barnesii]|uniref:Na+-driven multidrug efflux pump n=1 Tax=Sulfurospirillum barnesii (strain ATCC 700032 / DSM 10660 / SES-3) TaxID=760154 RepID=I3XYX3_SULBS|nr:oligosaccharide flippase family protein [Sulfurospirillum barnesii]AFL69147.1 Na+-driven multidrug efflux pump [Sulfurospirillum barnesii SES-3]